LARAVEIDEMTGFTSGRWPSDTSVCGSPERISDLAELADVLTARHARLQAASDARAAFCRVYAAYSACLARAADAGAFGAGAGWIARLEIEAATQYVRALDAWDRRNLFGTAAAWRAAFAATKYGAVTSSSALRLAFFAHLGYDLPLAVARAGFDGLPQDDAERAFTCASELLAAHAGAMAELLEGNGQKRVGRPFTAESLATLRVRAWNEGRALAAAPDDDQRAAFFAQIERAVLRAMREG
jgi:hypothetical protein